LCTPTSFIFHAALYSVFLAITDVADSPGHSSPGEAFVPVMWLFLMFVVAADAVVGGGVVGVVVRSKFMIGLL
jgi:hypothetical protein